jgi:hypothetical protein
MQVTMACRCQPKENLQSSAETPKRLTSTQCSPAATQKRVILASLILESEQLMGEVIADEDEIDDSRNDSFSLWINPFPDTDPLSLIHIAGDINYVCYATSFGTYLAISFRLALLTSLLSILLLMTPNGKSHVIVPHLDPNQLLIKPILHVRLHCLKSKGSSKNQMRLIIAKSSWFLNLMVLNACV